MLTGLATLAGAAAVAYAAVVGRSTFEDWRRQRQEERRIDAAEQIMTLAYRLKDTIHSVRSPLIQTHELKRAAKDLQGFDGWDLYSEEQRSRARTAQSILRRLKRYRKEWREVWSLKPLALAYFGPDVDRALHRFWAIHLEVAVAAQSFRDDFDVDGDELKAVRKLMIRWGKPDPIAEKVDAAIEDLEESLIPVLRHN